MQKKISKFKYMFKHGTVFRAVYKKLIPQNRIDFKSKKDLEVFAGHDALGYWPNLDDPQTFNEKVMWLKLNYRNSLWEKCADKFAMKSFLKENGFGHLAPEVLGGPWHSSAEIDLNALPKKFVLKTNHDCGSVFFCDKSKTDFQPIFKKLDESLYKKYSDNNNEWDYENIKPVIFAEEFLVPAEGEDLCDYKFFCMNHDPKFLFVASNRSKDVHINFKTLDYQDIPLEYVYPPNKKLGNTKPKFYDDALNAAKIICQFFDFVRIDFYLTIEGPKIGEFTFFPHSGHGRFFPKKYDYEFGKMLNLSFAAKNHSKNG